MGFVLLWAFPLVQLSYPGLTQFHHPQQKPLLLKLIGDEPEELLGKANLAELGPEAPYGGLIRYRTFNAETEESEERDPVPDGLLQLAVREVIPPLKQKGLEHNEGRIRRTAKTGVMEPAEFLLQGVSSQSACLSSAGQVGGSAAKKLKTHKPSFSPPKT